MRSHDDRIANSWSYFRRRWRRLLQTTESNHRSLRDGGRW